MTYWIRDKGFGMSGTVGCVQAVIGGQRVNLSQTGVVFPLSEDNLRRWKGWWGYLRADQWYLWTAGCIIGMGLPVLATITFIRPGTIMGGYGVAAYHAQALTERFGPPLWVLTLLSSFWILFSTQLGNTEGFARVTTDILWVANNRIREWRGGNVRAVYYTALLAFALWGCIAITLADPLTLILTGANIAGVNLVVLSLHTLVVNRKFLPRELRPPLWREVGLGLCALSFFGFAVLALTQQALGSR